MPDHNFAGAEGEAPRPMGRGKGVAIGGLLLAALTSAGTDLPAAAGVAGLTITLRGR
jgi:hypothetical protein